MSNDVSTIKCGQNPTLELVSQRTSPSEYWLGGRKNLGKVYNVGDITIPIMTPEEARKTNNLKIIGMSIAGVTVLTAAGIFLLLKGGPKGLNKNFVKLRNFLDKKIQQARLENPENPKINKLYVFIIKNIDKISAKSAAINNFTTLKDFAFKKAMYNKKTNSITGKVHLGITRLFERMGRQTVIDSYKSTYSRISETIGLTKLVKPKLLNRNLTQKIEINGETKTIKEWIEVLDNLNDEIGTSYQKHFDKDSLIKRYLRIKQAASDMDKEFSQKGHFWFWSKDTLNKFVAESTISTPKKEIQDTVQAYRRQISYKLSDLVADLGEATMNIVKLMDNKDPESIRQLREIQLKIKNLGKVTNKNNQNTLREDIIKDLTRFKEKIQKSTKSEAIEKNIDQLKESLDGFKDGKIEKALAIYKKLLSRDEYWVIENSYQEAIKSLDKSIALETEDFVSKIRDLTLGSAPTDILTILGSFGTLGYYLAKTKNKQERESILLKYGIPALAGIATSSFCNIKLLAGTKQMIFASLSAIVVGKIGSWTDNMLKKHNKNKNPEIET